MQNQYLCDKTARDNPWSLFTTQKQDEPSEQIARLARQSNLAIQAAVVTTKGIKAPTTPLIIEKDQWLNCSRQLDPNTLPLVSLLVHGFDELEEINEIIQASALLPDAVWVDFPVFSDGRGYSLCQLLRRQFKGQIPIGVIGDVLRDQVFFYWRCGFSLIAPRHDQDINACAKNLDSFSHAYQLSYNQP